MFIPPKVARRGSHVRPSERRHCPICGGHAGRVAYPYSTFFAGRKFEFVKCRSCNGVYVDPLPDSASFTLMYSKSSYHDIHYSKHDKNNYQFAASFLRRFASEKASVLDYGCGLGGFLTELKRNGFSPTGVEFDEEAALQAKVDTGCEIFSLKDFTSAARRGYDVLHLGDVIAHLPDPRTTLKELLEYVKPGGFLFIEGPLQNNPSPVFWAAQAFGRAKHLAKPNSVGDGPPTHLFRADEKQHLLLFKCVEPRLELLHWEIFETGWPYENSGGVKRMFASIAMLIGGARVLGMTFGNRFRAIFRKPNSLSSPG
jgi:SAM-dependent methyltransferase